MPLYELVCIAGHYRQYSTIRDLVRSTALHVMEHGGNVRSIESWGTHNLPEKMRRHKINHFEGDYWTMQFDCSPITLQTLNAQYQIDPRVIRWTNIKLGGSISQLSGLRSQTVGWGSSPLPGAFKKDGGDTLLQEELLQSVEAKLAMTAAFEQRAASRQIGDGSAASASVSGSLPPSMGLNASLQERRDLAKKGGADMWSDITVTAKQVQEKKSSSSP